MGARLGIGPRVQALIQFIGFGVLLCLAVAGLLYANTSSGQAGNAAEKASQGVAACHRLIATYADGAALRRHIKAEWVTTATIREETAKVFTQLANLSPKASVGQTKILNLALAYSEAAAKVRALAEQVKIPPPPRCAGA